jgi:hypothetical protein
MKKALLFIAAVLMSASMIAQTRTTFISEHFDDTSAPAGWTVMGSGTSNWGISATQNAGGEANELVLVWNPQFNGTSRMVMPAVDLTGVSSVVVSFKHALDNYTGSHTLGIATSSDGGATWNVGWQQNYSSSNSWSVTENVTTADMGNSNVQFCIFYTGNSYNINNWYFDDIEIFSMENLDLALNSINMNSTMGAGTTEVAFTVQNKGLDAINQFKMGYQIDEEEIVEQTFDVTLASLATQQFSFAVPASFIPGSYNITVGITEVNGGDDDDPSNNVLEKVINVALGETQKIAMIEHFSSSTCGPCVSVNTGMSNLTNQAQNQGKFTYTKYQMNWPGNGDPYYTEEGGVRRQFYGVNAVPNVCLEGTNLGATTMTQAQLDNAYNTPSFADVRGSFNVDGNNITVKVDFMAYYDMTVEKAFVTVNEKETHNNVGTNGETSFHHVFMKFLTSPSGDALNIPAGEYQHFEWTQNMSGTHVEEMSDLEVSAWIQNIASHEVINSHFLYEYTDIHPYPVRDLAAGTEAGTLTATWTAPEGGNALSYNVYVNGELAENVTALEYTAPVAAEFNVVEVEAVYENDMTSVKMVKAAAGAPVPQTEPTISVNEITFEGYDPVTFTITNETAGPCTINSISEVGLEYYLHFETSENLPATLEVGESLEVTVWIALIVNKGYVETTIEIVSDLATQTIPVFMNEEIFVGVNENSNTYEVYPNPTDGIFTIEGANITRVEVFNLVGQMVYEAQGKTVTVDASNWNKGIYMINIIDQNGSIKTQKLMVK